MIKNFKLILIKIHIFYYKLKKLKIFFYLIDFKNKKDVRGK